MGLTKSQKTKRKIIRTFYELAETNRPALPTVQQICAELDISRSTFYFHFAGIEDLIEMEQNRIIQDWEKRQHEIYIRNRAWGADEQANYAILKETLEYAYSIRQEMLFMMRPDMQHGFREEIERLIREGVMIYMGRTKVDYMDTVLRFEIGGIYSSVYGWLQDQALPLEEFAGLLAHLQKTSLDTFAKKPY